MFIGWQKESLLLDSLGYREYIGVRGVQCHNMCSKKKVVLL